MAAPKSKRIDHTNSEGYDEFVRNFWKVATLPALTKTRSNTMWLDVAEKIHGTRTKLADNLALELRHPVLKALDVFIPGLLKVIPPEDAPLASVRRVLQLWACHEATTKEDRDGFPSEVEMALQDRRLSVERASPEPIDPENDDDEEEVPAAGVVPSGGVEEAVRTLFANMANNNPVAPTVAPVASHPVTSGAPPQAPLQNYRPPVPLQRQVTSAFQPVSCVIPEHVLTDPRHWPMVNGDILLTRLEAYFLRGVPSGSLRGEISTFCTRILHVAVDSVLNTALRSGLQSADFQASCSVASAIITEMHRKALFAAGGKAASDAFDRRVAQSLGTLPAYTLAYHAVLDQYGKNASVDDPPSSHFQPPARQDANGTSGVLSIQAPPANKVKTAPKPKPKSGQPPASTANPPEGSN